jgi:hypothetical protein
MSLKFSYPEITLSVSIRDQYGIEIPNFPDSHLVLQFSKRLRGDKYGTILAKLLDYINKISLIISDYFLGNNLLFSAYLVKKICFTVIFSFVLIFLLLCVQQFNKL